MSRTIKFRCWDIQRKRLAPVLELVYFADGKMRCNASENPKDYIPMLNGYETGDEFVLMQFTGLTDRNGKEIYESDLVRDEDHTYTVVWDQKLARWLLAVGSDPDEWHLNSKIAETLEVIGDIYSTPSLLEER